MDNKELKEEFEKEVWSQKDNNITPLEFSSKWWLAKMDLQRKESYQEGLKFEMQAHAEEMAQVRKELAKEIIGSIPSGWPEGKDEFVYKLLKKQLTEKYLK